MAREKTVVLIKPDAVYAGQAADIIGRYLENGLQILYRDERRFSEAEAKAFYSEHVGRFYFPGLVLAMTSGPLVALVLEGENAIAKVRDLNGLTDPNKASLGTIRHDFRSAGGPFNTVHASDSARSATREIESLQLPWR